jgi:wyosine [tRNA(Phe)-imidazoG37] synthetase (radical SAM superfamily)
MATILFDKIVFGPIKSRRLGISLGINLLPINTKVCSFDCIYCECGLATKGAKGNLPTREEVKDALYTKLNAMRTTGVEPDVITFAGNGEPTLHPEFESIINDTIELRNSFFPNAKISVLSNATTLDRMDVFNALTKVDNNILKLDSAIEETMQLIDVPLNKKLTVKKIISDLKRFQGNLILQTMFIKGKIAGKHIDNTQENEVRAWIEAIKEIKPKQVMIYSIDRETPFETLEKVGKDELQHIADKVEKEGFNVSIA